MRQNDEASGSTLLSEAFPHVPPQTRCWGLCPSQFCLDLFLLLTHLCLSGPWCPRGGELASLRPPGRVLGCHRKAEERGLMSEEWPNCGVCKHVGAITPACVWAAVSYKNGGGALLPPCAPRLLGLMASVSLCRSNRKHRATVCFFHRTPGMRCLLWWRRWFS